jgi:sn-glycerol 3-phosphate transport system ATP-binding protein
MNLIPVQVENGQMLLEGAMDRPLRAPALALAEATSLTLGIRPEDVRLTNGTSRDGIPAVVDLVEELGGSRVGYCSVGSTEIAVILPPGADDLEGRRVNLKFPGESIHLFDTQSGERVPIPKAERNAALPEHLAVFA